MKRLMILLTAAVFVPALAACGAESGNAVGGPDLNQAAANDSQAAGGGTMMDAHMRMQDAMAGAVGANAAETWVRKMIEHHRGGVEMSEVLLAQGGDPQVLEKARMTAEDQRREQQELEAMLQAGIEGSGPANPFAEAEARMNQQMMAAQGATPAETWMRMMIAHHRGGAEMAEILIRQGGDAEVVAMARRTAEKQNREAAELERMLEGEPAAAEASDGTSAAGAAAAPKAASREPQRREPATEQPNAKAEAPAADPHAGHDMGNMANMQH